MDAPLFLTDAELHELTGYSMASAQKRWLKTHGWEFVETAFGRPRILRAFVEARMGLETAKPIAQTEPDFSHWKKVA